MSELIVKTPVDCEQWHERREEKCIQVFNGGV